MRPEIGAAFIGGGFMTRVHSSAARASGARLRAVTTSTAERSHAAARALGIESAYDGLEAITEDSAIDVVHVCTPNALHAQQAITALESGKHVVCEKPLATTLDDAQRVLNAQQEAGVVGTVPFIYRYHPMIREARSRIAASGELVLSVHAGYLQDWLLDSEDGNWRIGPSGGSSRAFADIGSHLFDLIEFTTGEHVARLNAVTRRVFSQRAGVDVENEDIASVMFELSNGALGSALITQMAAGRKNSLSFEIHTSGTSYGFEQETPDTLWLGRREGSVVMARDDGVLSEDASRLSLVPAGHPMGYQDAFNAFIADTYAAARGEKPVGLPTFQDGVRAVQLTEAVVLSAQDRTWIETPPLATAHM